MNRPITRFYRGWKHYQPKGDPENIDYLRKFAALLIEKKQSSPLRSRPVSQTK